MRAAFSEVQKRVLPGLLQQKYAEAKAAFDRKDFVAAKEGFARVLEMLTDPRIARLASQPPLSDLTTLARGFHDLSTTSATVPATAASSVVPRVPQAPSARPSTPRGTIKELAPSPTALPLARIYTIADRDVVAPVTIRQVLPPFPRNVVLRIEGIVEVVISETGAVESAAISTSSIRATTGSRSMRAGPGATSPPREAASLSSSASSSSSRSSLDPAIADRKGRIGLQCWANRPNAGPMLAQMLEGVLRWRLERTSAGNRPSGRHYLYLQ